jgi:hypothetical protein
LAGASILYDIIAKRSRVQDHAHTILKKEKNYGLHEPTLRIKIA